eukprot:3640980-Amphidinium_carterae.1
MVSRINEDDDDNGDDDDDVDDDDDDDDVDDSIERPHIVFSKQSLACESLQFRSFPYLLGFDAYWHVEKRKPKLDCIVL